jgi:AcrR family transcriptional regulator
MDITRSEPAPTRDSILASATRLLAARGFDGTSLQDVADTVGVRKQSLLYHFPSKDELRREVLEGLLSRLGGGRLPAALAEARSLDAQVDAFVGELLAFFAADRDGARLLLREALDRPVATRELLGAQIRPWVGTVAAQLRRGQRRGQVRAGVDAEAFVLQIVGAAVCTAATADSFGEPAPAASAAAARERLASELVAGVRARPARRPAARAARATRGSR